MRTMLYMSLPILKYIVKSICNIRSAVMAWHKEIQQENLAYSVDVRSN